MSRKTDTVVARTIGIDTGKNALHLREKLARDRIGGRL
jgi:hypothetical protein